MGRLRRVARAHPLLSALAAVVLLALGLATWSAVSTWRKFAPVSVSYEVPVAPKLVPTGADQTVYRIDASRSSITYEVEENLAGTTHSATGSTSGVAGDILIDDADPSASKVGTMVVDVKQLRSDQSLRDNRIRREFLQSKDYPLATFATTRLSGMPETIEDGTDYHVRLQGELTIKATTRTAVLEATARRDGDELHVTATTTVTLSDYDIGPIRIVGLVSTGNEATLRFDLVAVDTASQQPAGTVSVPEAEATATDGPSFTRTVQPVLAASCASCHQRGGAGSNEWRLDDAGDAAEAASGLALVVQSGYMPPWPASDVGMPLAHSLRLSDDDVRAVVEWAKAGGPLDVDPSTPITADQPEVTPPRHDLALAMPAPYQGTVEKQNDYRCFVLDPELSEPTVVTGYDFEPDVIAIVHHALVYRLHRDRIDDIAATDAADPGPGWECFGGINVRNTSVSPSGSGGGSDLMMGYAPGQPPTTFPEGTGMKLDAGDVFVMQMHYHVTETPPADQSTLSLELGVGDPDAYDGVRITTYLAPAEIPCGPGQSGPRCDRSAELEELERLYGPPGPMIANGLHVLCGTTPEELGVLDDDLVARTSCDHRVGAGGELLAVLGHMHEIGSTFRMTLNPGTPAEKILLDIPRWDFDWQFNYQPAEHIELHRGDVIRVECSWDRHFVGPAEEPHWITWAEGTEDEMCFSTVATREPGG